MSDLINILCVDDRPENLLALELTLQGIEANLIKAASGEEALEYLLMHEVALILLDVMMPNMDGYETATLIRGNSRTQHIPIIFISAIHTDQEHIFKGYSSGAVDYLPKPINPLLLEHKVKIFLELYEHKKNLKNKAQQLEEANTRISLQQNALLENELRFRTAFEQSFQFMALLDPDGRVLELNRLAKNLCGDQTDRINGQYLWNVCWIGQEEENAKLQKAVKSAALGQYIHDEATFTDAQGMVHSLLRAVSPVKNRKDEVIFITVQGHDITGRVEAENEKLSLEKLLRQAQKMEALGTLAGGIAHDFNNILSVIIGSANLAEKGTNADSLQRQYLKQIVTAGFKAKDLVQQILSFSRQAEVEKVVLQPASIITESIKLLRSSIPSTIEIEHDIDSQCGSIFTDPIQYHQIIMNLCTNAFHAMEETGGTLSIGLQKEHVDADFFLNHLEGIPGSYAHLIVKDNGHGIQKENLEKIFDPYFTTKDIGKGTGMGLAIVHGIVKSHGGFTLVESQEKEGTAFHVYMPLVYDDGKRDEEPIDTLCRGTESILLVDDEQPLLEMGKDMLELMGYEVIIRQSSEEALQLFRQSPERFDLVITDQTMPEMTGIELARNILTLRPGMPIILCTGYSPNISRESIAKSGISELALKPLAIDEMSRLVRRTLDKVIIQPLGELGKVSL